MFWKWTRQQPCRLLQNQHLPDRGTDAYEFVPKTIELVTCLGSKILFIDTFAKGNEK